MSDKEQEKFERVPPNSGKMLEFLRAVGYSLEAAVADLIDNSIEAKAGAVAVRIWRDSSAVTRICIADDGHGIAPDRIREAMQFAGGGARNPSSLSKFGMGLKLASLSQATELTVSTRARGGALSGRRWTTAGIVDDWRCDIEPTASVLRLLSEDFGAADLRRHGTVVTWTGLDRINTVSGVDDSIERIHKRLRLHLGMHFHRFIEDKRLQILLDSQLEGRKPTQVQTIVDALNPFRYERSGHPDFPRQFQVNLGELGSLPVEGHVWPPESTSKHYKLDGRASARQGLYIYRNDRLIQAGGWNDGRDTEPHLSLARAAIDLPPAFDGHFALDVKKASIKVPPGFAKALPEAVDDEGSSFRNYTSVANKVYRKHETANPKNHDLVPSSGFRPDIHSRLRAILSPEGGPVRKVAVEWADLGSPIFFELDREDLTIRLNKIYRRKVLGGRRASKHDVPLLRMLMFLLLHNDLNSGRVSARQKEWLEQCSQCLATILARTDDAD